MSRSLLLRQPADLESLLQHAGAKPARYGKRWDCPTCGKPGHVSVNLPKGVFHCWHARCDFRGSTFTLARSLGFASPTAEQAREYVRRRELAQEAAARSSAKRRERRWQLYDTHQSLLSIQAGASKRLRREPQNEVAWSALAFTYRELPLVQAELLILEHASFPDRRRFARESEKTRRAVIDRVISAGGLTDPSGRFVELVYD